MGMLARGTPWLVIVPPALLVLVVLAMAWEVVPATWWSVAIAVLLGLDCAFGLLFFRDPDRRPGEGLLAAADGRVLDVADEGASTRISTFMGPLDVHVVRAPMEGRVVSMERGGSGFRRADGPGADHNVHLEVGLEGEREPYRVVMVSGWFARRIVPYVEVGDRVSRGSRIGLIRFGSRVDVLVPRGRFEIGVGPGSRVRAGTSSLGVRTDAHL